MTVDVCRVQAVQGGTSARGALKNLDLVQEVSMSKSVVSEGDTVELECRSVKYTNYTNRKLGHKIT